MKATLDRALLEARKNAENTGEYPLIEAVEEACEHIERRMEPCFAPPELVLDQVRLSTLEPQIIRTGDELLALDPETVIAKPGCPCRSVKNAINVGSFWTAEAILPAVVIATGAQVRAARTALQEATND